MLSRYFQIAELDLKRKKNITGKSWGKMTLTFEERLIRLGKHFLILYKTEIISFVFESFP